MSGLPDLYSPIVRAGLLRLDASRKERLAKPLECLREAYNLLAGELIAAKGTLDDTDLRKTIPEILFAAAVEFKWVDYPLRHQVQRIRRNPDSWIPNAPVIDWISVPIPDAELTEQFGPFRLTVRFRDYFLGLVSGRISEWQANATLRNAAAGPVLAAPELSEIASAGNIRPGRKPDLDAARKVAEIIKRVAGTTSWKSMLEPVCMTLDDQSIPVPSTWRKRDSRIINWEDAACKEPELVVKAIVYRLKIAKN